MNDMVIWIGVGSLVLGGAWFGVTEVTQGNLEEPSFETLVQEKSFQLRRYEPVVLASTPMRNDARSGMNGGFRALARYIFGGNKPAESLPMTAPVLTQKGESLPMTVPVLSGAGLAAPSVTAAPEAMTMAFVMPDGREVETLPRPLNPKVQLARVEWGLVASLRYGGYAKPKRFQQETKRLQAWIKEQGWTQRGPAMNAQYNSPWAFPLNRRNEVLIPVQAPQANIK
tara:strand:+ start:1989 stop:2669 length:681 start_codon:yes stop_codon:yes gene_type:complete